MDWPVLFWITYAVALLGSIVAITFRGKRWRRRRDAASTEGRSDSSPVLTAVAHFNIHP
jgi:hypothetical protein